MLNFKGLQSSPLRRVCSAQSLIKWQYKRGRAWIPLNQMNILTNSAQGHHVANLWLMQLVDYLDYTTMCCWQMMSRPYRYLSAMSHPKSVFLDPPSVYLTDDLKVFHADQTPCTYHTYDLLSLCPQLKKKSLIEIWRLWDSAFVLIWHLYFILTCHFAPSVSKDRGLVWCSRDTFWCVFPLIVGVSVFCGLTAEDRASH